MEEERRELAHQLDVFQRRHGLLWYEAAPQKNQFSISFAKRQLGWLDIDCKAKKDSYFQNWPKRYFLALTSFLLFLLNKLLMKCTLFWFVDRRACWVSSFSSSSLKLRRSNNDDGQIAIRLELMMVMPQAKWTRSEHLSCAASWPPETPWSPNLYRSHQANIASQLFQISIDIQHIRNLFIGVQKRPNPTSQSWLRMQLYFVLVGEKRKDTRRCVKFHQILMRRHSKCITAEACDEERCNLSCLRCFSHSKPTKKRLG